MKDQQSQAGGNWLTVAQASERLCISVRAVQKRCHNGTLPARRMDTPLWREMEN